MLGLAWIFTQFYGGPFVPFFAWLAQFVPHGGQIDFTPAPLDR